MDLLIPCAVCYTPPAHARRVAVPATCPAAYGSVQCFWPVSRHACSVLLETFHGYVCLSAGSLACNAMVTRISGPGFNLGDGLGFDGCMCFYPRKLGRTQPTMAIARQ